MRKQSLFYAVLFVALSMTAFAQTITVLESFEASGSDPAAWQQVSPVGQTNNATNATIPVSWNAEHNTDGALSGRFEWAWKVPAVDSTPTNPYVTGGPAIFWSMRNNVGAATNLGNAGSVPVSAVIKADIYNRTNDTLKAAFFVVDTGLEMSPLQDLAPNASTTLTFDVDTDPVHGVYGSGNGTITGASVTFRGICVYTETAPTAASCSLDVDNVRFETIVADVTPPGNPALLAAQQGSAAGKLLVKWTANTETDLAGYKVYLGGNKHFGTPIGNRLALPPTPIATIAAPATSTEIDVPTTGSIYLHLTAYDTTGNESTNNSALGASLRPDGAQPSDLVVLDLNEYVVGGSSYINDCYYGNIVYNAQSLEDLGRYFESCNATAVENGTVNLTPNANGLVIWANSRDGETAPNQTITDGNVAKIEAFVSGGGNLMISGSGLGEGMATNGSAAAQSFFAGILRAALVSDNSATTLITGGVEPFAAIATLETGTDVFNVAAGATNNTEVYTPIGATGVLDYSPAAAGNAAIVWGNKVVTFGFPFEAVRDNATLTFAAARAKRTALLDATVDYLLAPPPLGASSWEMYD